MAKILVAFLLTVGLSLYVFAQESSTIITQNRSLSDFSFITLKSNADVFVTQEDHFAISIEAPTDVIDKITTEVSDNTLEIGSKIKWTSGAHPEIKIYVSLPKPNGFEVDGSGNIILQTKIVTDYLSLEVNGSGNIKAKETTSQKQQIAVNGSGGVKYDNALAENALLEVNGSGDVKGGKLMSKQVSVSVTGSGQIRISDISSETISMINDGSGSIYQDSGFGKTIMMENGGSGDINAGNLNGTLFTIINSGSGNIIIGTGETLEAQLIGSGDIRYHVEPKTIHKEVSGSGRVSQY